MKRLFFVCLLMLISVNVLFAQNEVRKTKYVPYPVVTSAATTDKVIIINPTTREVTELTLANFLLSIFAAPTFTGVVTISGATASTIAGFDASKGLVTLATATYPSLTELAYVKGVSSAIQTQIGLKAPTADPTFTGTATAAKIKMNAHGSVIDSAKVVADSLMFWTGGVRYKAVKAVAQ